MFFDKENQLSTAQALSATSTVSADSYDFKSTVGDPSIGEQMSGMVVPKTIVTGTNTFQVQIVQADDAALTTNLKVIAESPASLALAIDTPVIVPIPQGSITQRYVGFRYLNPGSATVTVDAHLVETKNVAKNPFFPKVVNSI